MITRSIIQPRIFGFVLFRICLLVFRYSINLVQILYTKSDEKPTFYSSNIHKKHQTLHTYKSSQFRIVISLKPNLTPLTDGFGYNSSSISSCTNLTIKTSDESASIPSTKYTPFPNPYFLLLWLGPVTIIPFYAKRKLHISHHLLNIISFIATIYVILFYRLLNYTKNLKKIHLKKSATSNSALKIKLKIFFIDTKFCRN